MKNLSGIQITLVSILVMIAHHYRWPIAEADIVAVVAGTLSLIGVVLEIYTGWKGGTKSLGGFNK